jgi:hypothetical protein
MFTITISAPVALALTLAALAHAGGVLAAIAILSFVVIRYRAKRAEEALFDKWEAEYQAEVAAQPEGCHSLCGECWTCRKGEEPI